MMAAYDLNRRLFAEFLGTAMLVATVIGSGIMATRLTHDTGLALLANTIATGAMLVVLIATLGPISGAHFNPAVSCVAALRRELRWNECWGYVGSQTIGGLAGTMAAHAMFGLALLDPSQTARGGGGIWFSEWVASFGLLATILAGSRFQASGVPWLVGLYITSAYWFTASNSFANPAVAIARSMTNSFAGIRPIDVPGFIVAEMAGAVSALLVVGWLLRAPHEGPAGD